MEMQPIRMTYNNPKNLVVLMKDDSDPLGKVSEMLDGFEYVVLRVGDEEHKYKASELIEKLRDIEVGSPNPLEEVRHLLDVRGEKHHDYADGVLWGESEDGIYLHSIDLDADGRLILHAVGITPKQAIDAVLGPSA